MGKPPFYIVLKAGSHSEIAGSVNEHVELGYAPTGPLVSHGGKLLKEMIYVSGDSEHTDEEAGESDAD